MLWENNVLPQPLKRRELMYNKLKKFVFNNFSKSSYKLVSKIEGKEEIYLKDNKMVVLVEDEEVGKRLLDVVTPLKEWGESISSNHLTFKLTDFVADKFGTVKTLFINVEFSFEYSWNTLSTLEKLRELVSFAHCMKEKGYVIDDSIFDNEQCSNLSDFLSFFKTNGNTEGNTNSSLIKYIHYVLSDGGNMEEYYQSIINENKLCVLTDFPYHLPVIQMCYNYCKNSTVPENIDSVLKAEGLEAYNVEFYSSKLVVSNSDLSQNLPITENTDAYTVYNNCIKIHKEISPEFKEFLEDKTRFIRKSQHFVEERFSNWIINFDGDIIGYEYKVEKDTSKRVNILDNTFDSQSDVIKFIYAMRNYIHSILAYSYSDFEINKHAFNIETDLVIYSGNDFKVINTEKLYNLVSDDSKKIDEEITIIFFKLLFAYLENKYGKLSNNKRNFYEKDEVRFLNPLVAKEFYAYSTNADYKDISSATEALGKFLDFDMKLIEEKLVFCDRNLLYDSSNSVPFSFEHEVEVKYSLALERGSQQVLSDGRIITTLWRRKSISNIKNRVQSLNDEIEKKFGKFNRFVNIVEISEIIYSLDLNSENMYHVAGYITTPILGEQLSMSKFLNFSNKDLIKIAGMLISNFNGFYIPYTEININISSNNEFSFYINPLDDNFHIEGAGNTSSRELIKNFFELLIRNGYNKNAFVGLNLDSYDISSYLIRSASQMDAYCEEHKIYYDSDYSMCPVCDLTRCIVDCDDFDKHYIKLFEDKYAVHYRKWSQNLKIYKVNDGIVDIQLLEKNIDKILEKKLAQKSNNLQQDCFIPVKKVLDKSKKFIGYTYSSINFEDTDFNDLSNTDNLENLPRIMSLIRLILQIKELMYYDFYFIENPFGNVFLSKSHKKQVQIVNVDFLGKDGTKKNTVKWTCEYIRNIVNSDPNIELNTSKWKNDLDVIYNSLREYSQTLTMYCPIHKIYYSAEYLFCPKCVNKSQLKKLDIEYVTQADISSWEIFSQGGESIIYKYGINSLAKIFKENVNYAFKTKVLAAILSKSEILENVNKEDYKFKYIIPKKILVDTDSKKILGYVMYEKIVGNPLSVLKDKDALRDLLFDRKDVLEILITAGEGIQILHNKANIFIGDLNGRNILFDKDKNVYFLDFDGMGVDNISPLFWTEGYIDPVSQKSNHITKKDDWYSYAIQAFFYLTLVHPFSGIYEIAHQKLEIPERMERRLSLLGNHGIEIPTIAIYWDWMSKSLVDSFLNIFEGDSRNSIVSELKSQYQILYGRNFSSLPDNYKDEDELISNVDDSNSTNNDNSNSVADDEIIPIGSKFIAKKNNPFNEEVVRIINSNFAICGNESDDYYAVTSISGNQYKIHFPDCMKIIDIMLLENSHIAFAVYSNKIIGFTLETNNMIFCEYFDYDTDTAVINGNVLYLNQNSIIHQYEFDSSQVTKRDKIKFMVDQETVGFLVKFNSKFMLVKRTQNGTDKIYCNSEVLCEFDSGSDSKYNILYDDTTKMWLVISSNGKFITIKSSNGHYKNDTIPEDITDMNVKNVSFNKGIIYIPTQENLYLISVIDKMTTKKMECNKIMTPDSHLCNFNSKGFSVITDYVLYDVSKK